MSKPEEFKFDSRVRDRFLRSRVLSASDVQQHLEALPDLEGQYEVLSDTPQPAVTPPRSEVHEEPLVFDGIRRLQALSDASSTPSARYAPPAPPSGGLPSYREPESRPLGTPLRSALMESEISGVGAGAVSAALGAMAAEARGASVFGVPTSIPHTPVEEAVTPVTLRSEATAPVAAVPVAGAAAPVLDDADDDDDDLDVDSDDDDDDDDVEAAASDDDDAEDVEDSDDADDDDADDDDDDEDADDEDGDADGEAKASDDTEDLA
jgi:hypothetical protein